MCTHVCTCHMRTRSHHAHACSSHCGCTGSPCPVRPRAPPRPPREPRQVGASRGERRRQAGRAHAPDLTHPVAEQVAAGPSLPTSSRPAVPTSHHETSGPLGLFTQPSCSWAETQRPSHRWTPAVDLPKSPPATLPRRLAGSFSSAVPRPPSALPPDPSVFTAEFLGPPHLNVRATPGRSSLPPSSKCGRRVSAEPALTQRAGASAPSTTPLAAPSPCGLGQLVQRPHP